MVDSYRRVLYFMYLPWIANADLLYILIDGFFFKDYNENFLIYRKIFPLSFCKFFTDISNILLRDILIDFLFRVVDL